jgi:transcriptional regulator EpsA
VNTLSLDEPGEASDALFLTTQQADAVVRVVEGARRVRRRYQYFVWTQSQLQTLLPHQVLICGAYLRQRRGLVFDAFHSVVLPPELLAMLTDAEGPLLTALVAAWVDARGAPLILSPARMAGAALSEPSAVMKGCGFDALLVHGVARPQRPAEIESFFIFANPGLTPAGPTLAHIELMVPYLHWSWQRVVAAERELAPPVASARTPVRTPAGDAARSVTERERQILLWVREGKSNQQIAEVLGISPLTVKNHVQKILRKLGCSNRAQAVAEAIAAGLVPGAKSG